MQVHCKHATCKKPCTPGEQRPSCDRHQQQVHYKHSSSAEVLPKQAWVVETSASAHDAAVVAVAQAMICDSMLKAVVASAPRCTTAGSRKASAETPAG